MEIFRKLSQRRPRDPSTGPRSAESSPISSSASLSPPETPGAANKFQIGSLKKSASACGDVKAKPISSAPQSPRLLSTPPLSSRDDLAVCSARASATTHSCTLTSGGGSSSLLPSISITTSAPSGICMAGFQALTPFQKRLLVQTWPNVHKTSAGGIGNVVYQRLFRQEPKQRELLQKANAVLSFGRGGSNMTTEHIKLLTELLNDMIANIDRLDEVGERCAEIGGQHAPLHHQGFEADLWDRFGQVMLESITQLDSVRKHRELVKAWTVVISYLVDKFRQGYEAGVRRANYQQQLPAASQQQDDEDQEGDQNGTSSGSSALQKMSIR